MTALCIWLKAHEIGVTLIVLVISVPWYVLVNIKRKGDCEPQFWFMFSLNVVGIVTGAYVFLSALVASLRPIPTTDQDTIMTAFGGFAVFVFTINNIRKELQDLLRHEVQPKQRDNTTV